MSNIHNAGPNSENPDLSVEEGENKNERTDIAGQTFLLYLFPAQSFERRHPARQQYCWMKKLLYYPMR